MIHIASWFDYVESQEEFNTSYSVYLQDLDKVRDILGEHAVINIEKLVSNLLSKHEYLFHYNVFGRCTFGFKGDSISEASFSSLKCQAKKSVINGNTSI